MTTHFVSASCKGEHCRISGCEEVASHKLGEEIPGDDPVGQSRHSLTAYVCCGHYKMVVGDAAPCGETERDNAVATHALVMNMIRMLTESADVSKARNFVQVQVQGLNLPFDRANIEFMRPGGMMPIEKLRILQNYVERMASRLDFVAQELEQTPEQLIHQEAGHAIERVRAVARGLREEAGK